MSENGSDPATTDLVRITPVPLDYVDRPGVDGAEETHRSSTPLSEAH